VILGGSLPHEIGAVVRNRSLRPGRENGR
jgi:hypothetical protein